MSMTREEKLHFLLSQIPKNASGMYKEGFEDGFECTYDAVEKDFEAQLKAKDERIKELEEAQLNRREWYQKGYAEAMNHKTCDGCVHEVEDMQDLYCAFCSRSCDDNFEPKDNQ